MFSGVSCLILLTWLCLPSCYCCALILTVLIFHVNNGCGFLPIEGGMSYTSQTPGKFGVCYKIVALTARIKLIGIRVLIYLLIYICCNGT